MNGMIENTDDLITEYKKIIRQLTDLAALDLKEKQQAEESGIMAELIRKRVSENAITLQDQEAYLEHYPSLKRATRRLRSG